MRIPAAVHRALALALLVGLVGLAYAVLLSPLWHRYQRVRGEVIEHVAQTAHMLTVAQDAQRLVEQRDELSSQGDWGRYFIQGAHPTLAAAALQRRVESIVKQSGGRLSSTQVLRPEEEQDYLKVAIRVRLALDTSALQQVLYELEGRPPLLTVEALTIIARRSRDARRTHDDPFDLDVQFQVSGWMPIAVEGA